jgi:4-nitrophenyl phosphatase
VSVIKSILGSGELWVVGDRIETDMAMADKLGAKKILVLSGVAKSGGDVDFVVNNAGDIVDIIKDFL